MAPCVFCEIVAGRAPATIVRQWDDALAIVPLGPVVDGHTLVIPRQHVADFAEDPDVTAATARRAAELGRDLQLQHANLITSWGRHATQTVFHLHLHLVPRASGDGLPLPWTLQQHAHAPGGRAR
ncbi:MAG TPA: HIT domain-containing protein [Streptomyces sp.]|nr:HIT domain-containing protein [Streptomyces sp.]